MKVKKKVVQVPMEAAATVLKTLTPPIQFALVHACPFVDDNTLSVPENPVEVIGH